MNWKHGYYADSGYTYDYHIETSPVRLGWAAAINGFKHAAENFRYLDLGCGQGLSIINMAALHPDSEFIGIDFMPEHIAHAKQLAKSADLKNVTFIEADFVELVKQPHCFGDFDYVVAHGITTWISSTVREAMFELASKALKPGGIMYNSYNTLPGWLPMAPFQHLVLQLQSKHSGSTAIQIAIEKITNLQKNNSPLFSTLPTLIDRLERLKSQNQAYLVQEYNNTYWQPVYSNQMLEIAKRNKLELMSTASLPEMFEGCYPKPMWDSINIEVDPILKELIRDFSLAQNFRRDLYTKGGLKYWDSEALRVIDEQHIITTRLKRTPANEEVFEFKSGAINIKGEQSVYKPVLDDFEKNGASFKDVLKRHPEHTRESLLQMISLFLHGGWLGLVGENTDQITTSKKLNIAMAKASLQGAPYSYLCCPKIRSSFKLSQLDLMMIGLLNQSVPPKDLKARLIDSLNALNKKITVTGTAVDEANGMNTKITVIVQDFLEERYGALQRLGAI